MAVTTQLGFEDLTTLAEGDMQATLHSPAYIRGLIFAIAAAPEIPMPDQWFLWTLKQRGQIASGQQADHLADVLMGCLQMQLAQMRVEQVSLPGEYQLSDDVRVTSPLNDFFTGLLAGHSQLESVWMTAWETVAAQDPAKLPQMQKDLKHCLGMFTTFANIPLALRQAEERGTDLSEMLPKIYPSLTPALKTYVGLSGLLVAYMPDQFETFVQSAES